MCHCCAQHYSRDVLSFIFLALTAVNLWKALRPYNKGPDLLNRQQTDEWKGWMQVNPISTPCCSCSRHQHVSYTPVLILRALLTWLWPVNKCVLKHVRS